MHLIHRTTCRVCGSSALTKVIDLGEQYLQGSFVKPGKELPPTRRIPCTLVRCDPTRDEHACGLLQMEHTVPPEILYSAYWYRSGTNDTMRNHLRTIAEEATALVAKPATRVLDIGCNDGTLLGCYPADFEKFGIDPSDVTREIGGDITVIQDIFPSAELVKRLDNRPCDIITSIAMFYDLEEPVAFTRGIKSVLAPEGLWIFEMSYILKEAGMKVFNVSINNINGGSLRCYATHAENFSYRKDEFLQNIKTMRQQEFDLELDTDKPYKHFQDRINVHRQELVKVLKELKKQGKRIHIYGASTKGNTILQWCGIDNRVVDVAAERNPEKYGARTLGTDIPIVSEAESRGMNPDYYLVLPWHFKEEFVRRESETLARGTGLIFPLPKIEIVHKTTEKH